MNERATNGRMTRLLMFWDYDTQWGADRSRSGGGPKKWGPLEFANTERLLELHAHYRWPACFAVVGAAALPGERPYHDPAQIRRVHAAGHEIASHSQRHEWLPALNGKELRRTLVESKDALEQCIGAPVQSFVPPYNQPFDYAAGLSFSRSERRAVPRERTDLRRLCEALRETGYGFCRVAYRPWPQRLAEWCLGRPLELRGVVQPIAGVCCVRLNTPGGFATAIESLVKRCNGRPGLVVVYGHPHSLTLGNTQDERWLVPFLAKARQLRDQGLLEAVLPRDLLREDYSGDGGFPRFEEAADSSAERGGRPVGRKDQTKSEPLRTHSSGS
jgi:hypothetical protein